jgi:flagellar hook-basal body complex protein FliE
MGILHGALQADWPNRAGFPPYFRGCPGDIGVYASRHSGIAAEEGSRGAGTSSSGEIMTVINPLTSALQQIQSMAAEASNAAEAPGGSMYAGAVSGAESSGGFAAAMKASLDKISGDQMAADGEAKAFEVGAPNVSLNDVMIDGQKAGIGFQFALQVRNKLVSAYNEISQMQV